MKPNLLFAFIPVNSPLFFSFFLTPIDCTSASAEICARCHPSQVKAHTATSMARALEPAAECGILRSNPRLTFRSGAYSYTIQREGDRSIYTVTDGTQTFSVPIAWAFGLGIAGQTYVFEKDGIRYESRVSYYKKSGGLDLTLGALNAAPKDIGEAAGRQLTKKEDAACFGCHSAGGIRDGNVQLDALVPGVQCENCHAGGERHAAAMLTADAKAPALPKLGKLTAEEMSELCGKCHRTWADIAASGPRGVGNVRFQPYRLANSKCYEAFDARISCTGCHDPHHEVDRSASAYDAKCTACHRSETSRASIARVARVCRAGKAGCAGCHMPKYEIPGSHHSFSDHQIRIVRANEIYPN